MKSGYLAFLILCFLWVPGLIFILPGMAHAGDIQPNIESVLSMLEKKYGKNSFETQFSQTTKLEALQDVKYASGKAFFSYPGKMRWEYETPEPIHHITNGTFLWIYRPQENQVMTARAENFFNSGAGGSFLSDISTLRNDYLAHIKKADKNHIELELIPEKKSDDTASIVLLISSATHDIIRVTNKNIYDDTIIFDFTNTRFRETDARFFEFQIPDGVNVIEME